MAVILPPGLFHHSHNRHNAFIVKVESDFRVIESYIDLYKIDEGLYPERLEVLVPKYLSELAVDPWGNRYIYLLENNKPYISSFGADGVLGDNDLTFNFDSDISLREHFK